MRTEELGRRDVEFEITGVQIEPGNYPAVLEGVETGEGQYGTYRKWNWLVEVGPDKVESLTQLTSAHTGPQSTSFRQLTALLGQAPQSGTKVGTPVGKRVLLTIGKNDKGFPKVEAVSTIAEPQQTLPGIPR